MGRNTQYAVTGNIVVTKYNRNIFVCNEFTICMAVYKSYVIIYLTSMWHRVVAGLLVLQKNNFFLFSLSWILLFDLS